MSGLLVPSEPWERGMTFGANYLSILRETSHKLNNNYEGVILVTHFTFEIKLITCNERG